MEIEKSPELKIKGKMVLHQTMRDLTSLRIGGEVDIFAIPEDLEDLKTVLSFCKKRKLSFLVIGNGTKLLMRDEGFKGVALKLGSFFKTVENYDREIRVGAGMNLSQLIDYTSQRGLSGVESLAGIPGTIGGAIVRNASAFGQTLSERVSSVKAMDKNSNCFTLLNKDMDFGYRTSIFLKNKECVITEIRLKLSPEKKEKIISRVKEAKKRKVLTQPLSFPSAGCIFKNSSSYSAGFLIQQAGCLGLRVGDAQVSFQHANFIINKGNATAQDMLELIQRIRERVKDRFGISLESELEII
ncbi:MAG: UDP-N-acetylmuramate dehydrogenase [Candidatus Aerophobetes bacterium]|nr:UDP-N-acetylmuramate dehydrogenase [Candidatus Aerophobetes bacterium]